MPGENYNTENQEPTQTEWDTLAQETTFADDSSSTASESTISQAFANDIAQELIDESAKSEAAELAKLPPIANRFEALLQSNAERDKKINNIIDSYLGTTNPEDEEEIIACLWQAEQLVSIEEGTSTYSQLQKMNSYYPEYSGAKKLFEDCAIAETITDNDNPYVGVAEGFTLMLQIENSNPNLSQSEQNQNQILARYAQEYIDDQKQQTPESQFNGRPISIWPYLSAKRLQISQKIADPENNTAPNAADIRDWLALHPDNLKDKFLKFQESCHDKIPDEEEFMEKYLAS